ncbi:DUF1264-domain-containing protein [Aspergillus sclerotioniger CBS 115572]|uniref:DUF1264-domain-containing protein n=1 Tax=Aspergillus sclerotioniger CBS 115572 TaxID=1450535 RepID=A0A317X9J0_9EURO|nr:DUF1264-domain-containing protein [Aspergillus sclerotioniger CBS 115572]PWY94287.1 DUF1264-domain-containing protein [Aspergillus sclerotioniger CBS 115572]
MSTDTETEHNLPGTCKTTKSTILETGAKAIQDFKPVNNICAHLNAFHVYASDKSRCVEANHYCSHITEDIRQCLIYAHPTPNSPLIGIEYMITPKLFSTLPESEKALWHTHIYEVSSGMLIMPKPTSSLVPDAAWNAAETSEMRDILPLYGKTYHFWQVDRGDKVPLGGPELMASFLDEEGVRRVVKGEGGGLGELVGERDGRFGVDFREKRELRRGMVEEGLGGIEKEGGMVPGEYLSTWILSLWFGDVFMSPVVTTQPSIPITKWGPSQAIVQGIPSLM